MTTVERYVTAAYLVVLAAVLLYVVLYSFKLTRLERELEELEEQVGSRRRPSEPEDRVVGEGPQAASLDDG